MTRPTTIVALTLLELFAEFAVPIRSRNLLSTSNSCIHFPFEVARRNCQCDLSFPSAPVWICDRCASLAAACDCALEFFNTGLHTPAVPKPSR
jgi:hypothetical protein